MRARQDRQRGKSLWVLVGNLPRKTGTPIMADEVEPPIAMSDCRHDIERITHQPIDPIAGVVGRVWSRFSGIAPLLRGHCEETCLRHCLDLGIPEEPRHTEAVEHKDKRVILSGQRSSRRTPCRASSPTLAFRSFGTSAFAKEGHQNGGVGTTASTGWWVNSAVVPGSEMLTAIFHEKFAPSQA